MCSTRSNAFEASKNTACTDEPWVTKYEAVCLTKMYIGFKAGHSTVGHSTDQTDCLWYQGKDKCEIK